MIQKQFRGFIARKHYVSSRTASIMIQSTFRRFIARKCFVQSRSASIMIQKIFRGYLARKFIIHSRKASIKIQKSIRRYLARKKIRKSLNIFNTTRNQEDSNTPYSAPVINLYKSILSPFKKNNVTSTNQNTNAEVSKSTSSDPSYNVALTDQNKNGEVSKWTPSDTSCNATDIDIKVVAIFLNNDSQNYSIGKGLYLNENDMSPNDQLRKNIELSSSLNSQNEHSWIEREIFDKSLGDSYLKNLEEVLCFNFCSLMNLSASMRDCLLMRMILDFFLRNYLPPRTKTLS
jgi:hypothetical protein